MQYKNIFNENPKGIITPIFQKKLGKNITIDIGKEIADDNNRTYGAINIKF